MMRGLRIAGLSLALLLFVLLAALVEAGAAKPQPTKVIRPHFVVGALALDGSRVAYSGGGKVLVWNLRTGKTVKVSGKQSEGDGMVIDLAIAGSQVAWYENAFGNLESDDYLFTSSLLRPKERLVATAVRMGEACGAAAGGGLWPPSCAGKGIGGVVASRSRILANRWTANQAGSITHAGLYALNGTRLKPVASGTRTAQAVAADPKRVAVLHTDGSIGLYSSAGRSLFSVTPAAQAEQVALSGRNLVVLEPGGRLALYDTRTDSLRKTFSLHGDPNLLAQAGFSCQLHCNVAVQDNILVYSTPVRTNAGGLITKSAIRALNLSNAKDRLLDQRPGQIWLARIDSFGLVYANASYGYAHNWLIFLPHKQVAAAVS